MPSNDKMSTAKVIKTPYADSAPVEQKKGTMVTINIKQASTEAPSYHYEEVDITMPYSTENKLLPHKENIDMIMSVLTSEEKEEFLQELLYVSMKIVLSSKTEYIEVLRQLIVAWEYTAEIAANPELARDIDETRKEIEEDQTPGVEWRELLRG